MPFGALMGDIGRVSAKGGAGSASRGGSIGNGCERARARWKLSGGAPAYPLADDSVVLEDCILGRGIALGLLFECECEEVDVPGLGAVYWLVAWSSDEVTEAADIRLERTVLSSFSPTGDIRRYFEREKVTGIYVCEEQEQSPRPRLVLEAGLNAPSQSRPWAQC